MECSIAHHKRPVERLRKLKIRQLITRRFLAVIGVPIRQTCPTENRCAHGDLQRGRRRVPVAHHLVILLPPQPLSTPPHTFAIPPYTRTEELVVDIVMELVKLSLVCPGQLLHIESTIDKPARSLDLKFLWKIREPIRRPPKNFDSC